MEGLFQPYLEMQGFEPGTTCMHITYVLFHLITIDLSAAYDDSQCSFILQLLKAVSGAELARVVLHNSVWKYVCM